MNKNSTFFKYHFYKFWIQIFVDFYTMYISFSNYHLSVNIVTGAVSCLDLKHMNAI